eukprot:1964416-Rhodomonas_salina.1
MREATPWGVGRVRRMAWGWGGGLMAWWPYCPNPALVHGLRGRLVGAQRGRTRNTAPYTEFAPAMRLPVCAFAASLDDLVLLPASPDATSDIPCSDTSRSCSCPSLPAALFNRARSALTPANPRVVSQVHCGKLHSIAATSDGEVMGWGLTSGGRLGVGEVGGLDPEVVTAEGMAYLPVQVEGLPWGK